MYSSSVPSFPIHGFAVGRDQIFILDDKDEVNKLSIIKNTIRREVEVQRLDIAYKLYEELYLWTDQSPERRHPRAHMQDKDMAEFVEAMHKHGLNCSLGMVSLLFTTDRNLSETRKSSCLTTSVAEKSSKISSVYFSSIAASAADVKTTERRGLIS